MRAPTLQAAAVMAMASVAVSAVSEGQAHAAMHSRPAPKIGEDLPGSHITRVEVSRELAGDSKRARKLRKRLLEKARPVKRMERRLDEEGDEEAQDDAAQADADDGAYGDDAYADEAGNDDAQAGDDYYSSSANYDDATSSQYTAAFTSSSGTAFSFNPTAYSMSYHSCANVRQFDDELAATEYSSNVFATKHFAVFRLCPTETCNDAPNYGTWAATAYQSAEPGQGGSGGTRRASQSGESSAFEKLGSYGAHGDGCQSDYGEYILELGEYLEIMVSKLWPFIAVIVMKASNVR